MASGDITRPRLPTAALHRTVWPRPKQRPFPLIVPLPLQSRYPVRYPENKGPEFATDSAPAPASATNYVQINFTRIACPPGPWAPPLRRPILKTTARSYSWTTLNVKQREKGRVASTKTNEPMVASSSMNLITGSISSSLAGGWGLVDSSVKTRLIKN